MVNADGGVVPVGKTLSSFYTFLAFRPSHGRADPHASSSGDPIKSVTTDGRSFIERTAHFRQASSTLPLSRHWLPEDKAKGPMEALANPGYVETVRNSPTTAFPHKQGEAAVGTR